MGLLASRSRRTLVLMLATLGVAAVVVVSVYWMSSGIITSPNDCPIPVPPILFLTHRGSDELVFVSWRHTYVGEPRVADLTYELASYPQGADLLGRGNVTRSGLLSSLNTTGDLQFHDMEAESEFSPGNDFFILVNPPSIAVQLRILQSGTPIAWNLLLGCA